MNFQSPLTKSKSFNDYSILRKVPMPHQHTLQEPDLSEYERTTSYESIQFGRSFDQTQMRRNSTSSKDDISARKDSYITFEPAEQSISLKKIKCLQNPTQYIQMEQLQYRIWQRLQKYTQQQLEQVYILEIIVITDNEFEFKFDLSQLSCFWTVKQLTDQLSKVYTQQQNDNYVLQNPYLSIPIGKIKTQKLDPELRLFELLNMVLNGKQTLILQQS